MSTAIVVVMTRSMAKNCRSPRLVLICGRQEDRGEAEGQRLQSPRVAPSLWNLEKNPSCPSSAQHP